MKTILIRAGALLALAAAFSACAPLMVGGMVGGAIDRKSTRLNSITLESRMPSSA